jgi:hypothetical protein
MTELVSGMPAPQFGDFVSVRIRVGSRFKQFLCFVLINVRCLHVPPPKQAYPTLKTTELNYHSSTKIFIFCMILFNFTALHYQ